MSDTPTTRIGGADTLTPIQEAAAYWAGVRTPPCGERRELLPTVLISRYCGAEATSTATGEVYSGCCDWDGRRGYDEGYDWSQHLSESGWVDQPAIGEAPHSMWMVWPARPSDPRHILAHYVEGEITVEVFDTHGALTERLSQLRETEPGC